ncbi:MarR family transcriptional regulator [Erysipelothrix rhusiopathiae]|uniref:MarR family winged helix-turn-helix transcriptional regulator n=1 Tax=Erysipelothrix rhusiopathiae TaxID=1648 RepID=UPI000F4349D3|nr:MarR family transcriptional regulator [Erysipelothrix rhusiopathiae]AYV34966.1 MarR family transcriptional regulator [Erysipelothrix rhusiopathiae]MDE8082363.1 MarR family transcriptional regulator [Erysipelothrix rhusiopathiae]MDE8315046.1 MarR family transcriptional regulator [Erysipelothrix rhusiopathiae]MDE8330099.1 MarR family transcriptional regulator [Erysipelothrix rhusiopathiae]MDE8333366.1 MarR family transcriptional regulator [Erysipelothrix rhusiopathiae]
MESVLSQLYRALERKHRSVVQTYLDTLGLYIGQPRFLFELYRNPGLTQRELAEILVVTKETVSVALKRLEQGGFIRREIPEDDKRCRQLYLTEKGEATIVELKKNFDSINNSMFLNLSTEQQLQLEELLTEMIKGLEARETNENVL